VGRSLPGRIADLAADRWGGLVIAGVVALQISA